MNQTLPILYRILTWFSSAFSVIIGVLVFYSIFIETIGTWYVFSSLFVALIFIIIAILSLVMERSIRKIFQQFNDHPPLVSDPKLVSAWRHLFLILIILSTGATLTLASLIVGIAGRVIDGHAVFG